MTKSKKLPNFFRWAALESKRNLPIALVLAAANTVALFWLISVFGGIASLTIVFALIVLTATVSILLLKRQKASYLWRLKNELLKDHELLSGLSQNTREHSQQLVLLETNVSSIIQREAAKASRTRAVQPILEADHLQELLTEAAPAVGLSIEKSQIHYLARRVMAVESLMRGRLACPVATQVLRNLCLLSLDGRHARVLEIGTLFGGAVMSMNDAGFTHFDKLEFTVVDPLDGYYGQSVDPMTGETITEKTLRANLDSVGITQENSRIVVGLSEDPSVVAELTGETFDLLLIDGDHSYEGVSSDWTHYSPLIRSGGLILVDDYENPAWPEVTRFVDELLATEVNLTMLFSGFDTAVIRVP